MNTKINSILLRRKSKVLFKTAKFTRDMAPVGAVGAVVANIAELGYVLDNKLINELRRASMNELVAFYTETVDLIKSQIGHVRHRPMYPNFPQQVAEAAYEELWLNAIMHYFGDAIGVRIVPEYAEKPRFPFTDLTKAKWIGLATDQDVSDCFKSILEAKSSPSEQDKTDIHTFLNEGFACEPVFTNKETLSYFLCACEGKERSMDILTMYSYVWGQVKTATDVLRYVVAKFGGDVSLGKNTKFGKLSRQARRNILAKLEGMNQESVAEDFMRHRNKWIRLAERLHPTEYVRAFPKVAESFRKIRNEGAETFNSKAEKLMDFFDVEEATKLFVTRPGDFARRLNAILSRVENSQESKAVIDSFSKIADRISTPVLLQLYGHFNGYQSLLKYNNRIFIPKSKPTAIVAKNNLKKIALETRISISDAVSKALQKVYKEKSMLSGKTVYIDPVCTNLLVPTGNRTASTALRQVGRGSRFSLGKNKSTVRLFMYWKDQKNSDNYRGGRVDLDLSAVMFDANWNYAGHCSWTNLRYGNGKDAAMVHSGDITSAPNGASEFLDINLTKLADNVAYIACNVNCYTGQKMNQLDVAFMGWMERDYAGSGEIYEPKSVEGRCDLTADATSTCPAILDVKNRQIIWIDLPTTLQGGGYRVENTMNATIATAALAARMYESRATIEDVLMLHVEGCGAELTDNREEADFVVAEDGDLSPFDVANIMANWV